MITIIEAIGKNYKKIKLKDNESYHGGKKHMNETLDEFMKECNISPYEDYAKLCISLEECGLKAVRPLVYIDLSDNEEKINLLEDW